MKEKQRESRRLRPWEIGLLAGLALCLLTGAGAFRAQAALSEKVVRLHVLANSDSEADQALKLEVRDAVLARAEQLLEQASDRREAERVLRDRLPELEALAAETVRRAGASYPVRAELADTDFPTREYQDFALPAGRYLALRVLIGEAEGQNWWCVVFPPLCAAASADLPEAALAAGLSREDLRLITEEDRGCVVRFKTIELWESFRQRWEALRQA